MENTQIKIDDLLAKLNNADEKIRVSALDECVKYGAAAIRPLVETSDKPGFETARMAKRCLWKIVRYCSAPGEDKFRKSVCSELTTSLKTASTSLKREILWMLSEIGDDDSIPVIAEFIKDKDLRDDARCSLQRIPSRKALKALEDALKTADEEFKYAIADSLRAKGVDVKNYPTKKLTPVKQTSVGKKA